MESLDHKPLVSIIVPTKNEAPNIFPLVARIEAEMKNTPCELIYVDDSNDETPDIIREAQRQASIPMRLIARPPNDRKDGLSGAVVEGMRIARSKYVCVMDGDLQHPPEMIPNLINEAVKTGGDLIIASRMAINDGTQYLGHLRSNITHFINLLLHILFPKLLRDVSDPLTGFFLLRNHTIELDRLYPTGYKILLEIVLRNPDLRIAEIPFKIQPRYSGKSKANFLIGMQLAKQVFVLRIVEYWRLARFITVGFSGLFVNNLLMVFFVEVADYHYLLSAVIATQGSTLWNFSLTERWVFAGRDVSQSFFQRMFRFFVMNNLFLLLRGPFLALLTSRLGIHYLVSNIISIITMTLVRFLLADRWIWSQSKTPDRSLPFYYDIHGIIKIESMARLPELEHFRSVAMDHPDIRLRIDVPSKAGEGNNCVNYEENLKGAGFSIQIRYGDFTDIIAAPLLQRSPHVLYTNVVEPILRWTFVRRGYALVHGACLAFKGNAIIVTAQTDTGKTTTILRSLANFDCSFLSDDMTILSSDGRVFSYPKPLTISWHTVKALCGTTLGVREKLALQIQSRLHSRTGRQFGLRLSQLRLPAATLNAVVQMIIPPPKYPVNRLVPNTVVDPYANLSQVMIIERGPELMEELDHHFTVEQLLVNAEDAYGFPPYPFLADSLSRWEGEDLHCAEREIISRALYGCSFVRLKSPSYGWWRMLPEFLPDRTYAYQELMRYNSVDMTDCR